MSNLPDNPDGFALPPHAYVPGQNARHPEGWFDEIKASVLPQTQSADLHYTAAWKAGLVYFESGYFWECHEVLEPIWMQTPDGSAERDMVQAVIQLANARLKLRMSLPRAARRLCDMVTTHLAQCPQDRPILGLHATDVAAWVRETQSKKI